MRFMSLTDAHIQRCDTLLILMSARMCAHGYAYTILEVREDGIEAKKEQRIKKRGELDETGLPTPHSSLLTGQQRTQRAVVI